MNIILKTYDETITYPQELHVLTYAEAGFSPLDIHARKFNLGREIVASFAEAVNLSCEVGTLYPAAPISAVPRPCIRDTSDQSLLEQHLHEFLEANAEHIKATSLLLDFRTPRIPVHARRAINAIFKRRNNFHINNLIIMKD